MVSRRTFWLAPLFALAAYACGTSSSPPPTSSASTLSSSSSGSATQGGSSSAGGQGAGGQGAGGQGGSGGAPLNVLFVGNSYTFFNDLPSMLVSIDAGGPAINVQSVTVGGATLADHWSDTGAQGQIQAGDFTHVVLQGHSLEPLFQPAAFFSAAASLAAATNDTGAKPVFFETWARVAGHTVYQQAWSGGSPTAMQAGLRAAYQQAADDSVGVMAPVGDAFEASLAAQPASALHQADGSHPNISGTYLAAAVIYLVLAERTDFAAPAPAPDGVVDGAALRALAIAEVSGR